MADNFLASTDVVSDEQSFYNVLRNTGMGQTPFWDSLMDARPYDGNPASGYIWYQNPEPTTGADNKHLEGSLRADVEQYPDVEVKNHLQILKRTYGITKSEKAAKSRIQSEDQLKRNRRKSLQQLRLDMEYAFLKATAPVQRTAILAGEMGGLRHFITTVIDGTNTVALDYVKHIDTPLKTMWEKGVIEDKIILCGTSAKQVINGLLDTEKRYGKGDKGITRNVSEIEDAGWATNVKVIASTFLAANEIIIYAPKLISPVLLRQEKDNEVTDVTYDSQAFENLFEVTLMVEDPYAAVHVKNLLIA